MSLSSPDMPSGDVDVSVSAPDVPSGDVDASVSVPDMPSVDLKSPKKSLFGKFLKKKPSKANVEVKADMFDYSHLPIREQDPLTFQSWACRRVKMWTKPLSNKSLKHCFIRLAVVAPVTGGIRRGTLVVQVVLA